LQITKGFGPIFVSVLNERPFAINLYQRVMLVLDVSIVSFSNLSPGVIARIKECDPGRRPPHIKPARDRQNAAHDDQCDGY